MIIIAIRSDCETMSIVHDEETNSQPKNSMHAENKGGKCDTCLI